MKKGYDYLYESVEQLPPELAEVVLKFKFTQGFRAIINKYKLHLDQAEVLEDMTFRVMFAEMTPSEFVAKLVSELGLAPGTAKELADDTNTNIVEAVKKAIQEKINGMLEEYKDVELDDSEMAEINKGNNQPTPSPKEFHPKSIYNEPITDDVPTVHHIAPIHEAKLTHSDVLQGIENPHPSIGGNSPVRTASGSKSYADIMGGSTTVKPQYTEQPKQPVVEVKPALQPAPTLQQNVDMIAMKSSSVVVSTPNKIETLPAKPVENLPVVTPTKSVDPYKETI